MATAQRPTRYSVIEIFKLIKGDLSGGRKVGSERTCRGRPGGAWKS